MISGVVCSTDCSSFGVLAGNCDLLASRNLAQKVVNPHFVFGGLAVVERGESAQTGLTFAQPYLLNFMMVRARVYMAVVPYTACDSEMGDQFVDCKILE